VIERAGHFAVHILGRDQAELGLRFAKLLPAVPDPFEGLNFTLGPGGCPIVPDCIAWLECRVESTFVVGDHTLIIGAPFASDPGDPAGEPIVYHDRQWRTLA
jgi:flavin reductase (DIM6/NTAB) family NADH-FMN oxidoreductase RutF